MNTDKALWLQHVSFPQQDWRKAIWQTMWRGAFLYISSPPPLHHHQPLSRRHGRTHNHHSIHSDAPLRTDTTEMLLKLTNEVAVLSFVKGLSRVIGWPTGKLSEPLSCQPVHVRQASTEMMLDTPNSARVCSSSQPNMYPAGCVNASVPSNNCKDPMSYPSCVLLGGTDQSARALVSCPCVGRHRVLAAGGTRAGLGLGWVWYW